MGVVYPEMPPSKCTIAIVEDDASFRRALERLPRASGFEVQTFASAEEFLGSALPESHACLILDIRLPGMSGFELSDHLAASGRPRPAIFITAQDEDSARQPSVPDSQQCLPAQASCRSRAAGGRPFAAQSQQFRCGEPRNMRFIPSHSRGV
jgi:CheY-like chemotaxis protein